MLRLPYLRHLKWLCIEGLTFEEAVSYYDNLQFAKPDKKTYEDVKSSLKALMVSPATKKRLALKRFDVGDEAFWKKHGFGEIYLQVMNKGNWSELGRVLNHPVMRIALECCLVANLLPEEIEQLFPTTFSLPIGLPTIDLYKHYFFDYMGMGRKDWQDYLNSVAEDRYYYTRLFAALTKTQAEVIHMVGLPSKTQFGSMLKNIMNTANYKFDYYARQGSPEAQEQARKWAKLLIASGEKHEKFGKSDATDFSNLIQTEFTYLDSPIETVTPEMLSTVKPQITAGEIKGPDVPIPHQPDQNPVDPNNI